MRWLPVLLLIAGPCSAAPLVPSFNTGTMSSHTESKTQIVESIKSIDYQTGYVYSASGTNVSHSGTSMVPGAESVQTQTTDGVTSSWTGLALDGKPSWTMTNPGQAFQLVESYDGPGMSRMTMIERTTTVESVTSTTSVFGQ